ncbi:MAG: WYL domain-containing protein [Desulfobacteraceae bacterium]|nr:WYL domain-containing protein [Desulfobacteraceae bacterium]
MKKKLQRHIRFAKIINEIKSVPVQTQSQLLKTLGISSTQFHKDKKVVAGMGFEFHYDRTKKCYIIDKDEYRAIEGLSLSERLSLIMAFRQLSAAGDYILTFEGLNAAKKLAADMPPMLKESLFDDIVLNEGFGCSREIMEKLRKARGDRLRVILLYQRPDEDSHSSHELEPYQLFFKRRALYVEGYSWTEKGIRMYRLNRIKNVEITPYGFTELRENYNFGIRHKNAFSVFAGNTTQHVTIRFNRKISPYIKESLWPA